ncbi:hypothetical protein BHM03_00043867 [Ensete ventricosum]|nr:hypothetical protein BHM03_00043867 [Ensete ventricosum]
MLVPLEAGLKPASTSQNSAISLIARKEERIPFSGPTRTVSSSDRCPVDSKTDLGGKIVIAPTLAEAKTRHEQVLSRDNPRSSTLAQKDNKVTPRVGRYLAGRDSPPSQALLDEWVQRKPKTSLQSIYRDAHAGNVQAIRTLPRLRNMQPVFSRDAVPLPNHSK